MIWMRASPLCAGDRVRGPRPRPDGPGRDGRGELITTITDPRQAPAAVLVQAHHQRWEHETGNRQLKTYLRVPGRLLHSQCPDVVRQEIYGYLPTHFAISALICQAAGWE